MSKKCQEETESAFLLGSILTLLVCVILYFGYTVYTAYQADKQNTADFLYNIKFCTEIHYTYDDYRRCIDRRTK